jgi:flagellin-like protein
MEKKAVSEIIATVLLVLITVVAVSLVAVFLVPFIKDKMKEKECYDAIDKLTIENGKYTCFNDTETRIMVKRSINGDLEIQGIIVSLRQNSSSSVYKIYNNSETDGVKMWGSGNIKIPGPGGAQTYVFNIVSNYVSIAPILADGKMCAAVSQTLEAC